MKLYNLKDDISSLTSKNSNTCDELYDDSDEYDDSSSLQSSEEEEDPVAYINMLQEKKAKLDEKYGIEYDPIEYEEKKENIENRILRVRSRHNAWLQKHRLAANEKPFKCKFTNREILENHFPGGAKAADELLPRLLQPKNIVHSVFALDKT